MALTATDKLLAGWLVFVSVMTLLRPPAVSPDTAWLLTAHLLFAVLLWLFARTREHGDRGMVWVLRTFYPLILLPLLYAELGIINQRIGLETILSHDHYIQAIEQWVFGEQVSFTWIRRHPSLPWSQVLHGAYLLYYPIIFAGPPLLLLKVSRADVRDVVFTTMFIFVVCYGVYLVWPVAGPSYAFPHPDGPVVKVFTARLLYSGLEAGSSVGAAFPSSHVAATVGVTIAIGRKWRGLGLAFVIPAVLLTVGTVYTQMHYATDAVAGLALGLGLPFVAPRAKRAIETLWNRTRVERKTR